VTHDYVTAKVSRSLPDPGVQLVVLMLLLIAQFPTGNLRTAKQHGNFKFGGGGSNTELVLPSFQHLDLGEGS
jgi:hypothetical protein